MIGHRLIIKRRIPKGREQLLALFAGAFVIVGLVMIAQLKATLSARALTSVGADLVDIQGRLNNVGAAGTPSATTTPATDVVDSAETVTPADTAVEKFKKLLQEVPVTP